MAANFPISITPPAMQQLKRALAKDGREGGFIRLGVKGGGCSGFEYVMKVDTVLRDIDLILDAEDIRVVCDAKSAKFLQGATLEFTGNLMSGGLQFVNPNADRSCGCGTSFTPKPA